MVENATAPSVPGEDAGDPTAANELAQLEAMAGEESTAETAAAAEAQQQVVASKAERAAFYGEKARPFVDAWGSRLKYPLHTKEAEALSASLGAVGAEILPDGDGQPINPWIGLALVAAGIAVPRAIRSMNEKRHQAAAAPGSAARPGAEKKGGDPMLDGLAEFDAQSKPH